MKFMFLEVKQFWRYMNLHCHEKRGKLQWGSESSELRRTRNSKAKIDCLQIKKMKEVNGMARVGQKKKTGANGFSAYKEINKVDEIMVEKGAWLGYGQM